jgi:hypothetical protein
MEVNNRGCQVCREISCDPSPGSPGWVAGFAVMGRQGCRGRRGGSSREGGCPVTLAIPTQVYTTIYGCPKIEQTISRPLIFFHRTTKFNGRSLKDPNQSRLAQIL